jgi:hypothetical protein
MKRRFITGCGVAAALSAAATGCTQDGGQGAAAAAAPGRHTDVNGPAAELGHADELRISDAEQRLVKQCMNRRGFPFSEHRPLTLEESRPVGYVQDDADWAREHGYGSRIEAKSDRARRHNPNLVHRNELPAARRALYDTALDGGRDATVLTVEVPGGGGTIRGRTGGCVGEAQKQLYGDQKTWFRAEKAALNLRPLYVADLLRDQQFGKAVKAWAACMARAGHPYRDPEAAREGARRTARDLPPDKAFAVEKRIATADALCARDASLRAVGRQRQAHYIGTLGAEYREALDTHRRLQRNALARAEEIVGPRA